MLRFTAVHANRRPSARRKAKEPTPISQTTSTRYTRCALGNWNSNVVITAFLPAALPQAPLADLVFGGPIEAKSGVASQRESQTRTISLRDAPLSQPPRQRSSRVSASSPHSTVRVDRRPTLAGRNATQPRAQCRPLRGATSHALHLSARRPCQPWVPSAPRRKHAIFRRKPSPRSLPCGSRNRVISARSTGHTLSTVQSSVHAVLASSDRLFASMSRPTAL